MLKHKFNARPTSVLGVRFASKLEADVYVYLYGKQEDGEIEMMLRQVPFHLPGGVTYRVDFVTFNSDGSVHFIDAKGMETKTFKMKKKQVEDLYPVEIEIITKKDLTKLKEAKWKHRIIS